jgi:hypothetical protein
MNWARVYTREEKNTGAFSFRVRTRAHSCRKALTSNAQKGVKCGYEPPVVPALETHNAPATLRLGKLGSLARYKGHEVGTNPSTGRDQPHAPTPTNASRRPDTGTANSRLNRPSTVGHGHALDHESGVLASRTRPKQQHMHGSAAKAVAGEPDRG